MKIFRNIMTGFAAMAALSLAGTADASSLGIANEFNAFIFNDLTASGGDTEGRLAVGGNMTASSYGVAHGSASGGLPISNSHGAMDNLVVGGDLNAIGGWQVFNGNAVVGGNVISAPTFAHGSGNELKTGTPIDFAAAKQDLTAKSQLWSQMANTPDASIVEQWGGITLTGTDNDQVVFNITGDQLSSVHTFNINAPTDATILVNVSGEQIDASSFGMNFNGQQAPGGQNPNLLFNFYEATEISLGSVAVPGSVLAPLAHLNLYSGNINGVTVANSANTYWGGEFHHFGPFTGDLPEPSSAVPSPAAVWAGIMLLGSALIRRKR